MVFPFARWSWFRSHCKNGFIRSSNGRKEKNPSIRTCAYLSIIALSRLTIRISRANNKWFSTCECLCKRLCWKAIQEKMFAVFSLVNTLKEDVCVRVHMIFMKKKIESGLNVYEWWIRSRMWCKMNRRTFMCYRRTQHQSHWIASNTQRCWVGIRVLNAK